MMKDYKLGTMLTLVMVFAVLIGGYLLSGKNLLGDEVNLVITKNKESNTKNKSKIKITNHRKEASTAKEMDSFRGKLFQEKIWKMPNELTERSGIAWRGYERVGAIQVNDGVGLLVIF